MDVAGDAVTIHGEGAPAPIPVKNAEYIVDQPTLDKQLFHEPGFLAGWNGGATAGATLVKATQNQYSFSGGLSLIRAVPSVPWLNPRNRTSAGFTGSYGKITEPGTPPLKSSIYHIEGERDQYFSPRVFALGQVAFDHNFAQNLQLQQIYGGGFGWTALKTEKQEADLKGTIQYEKQQFIQDVRGKPGSDRVHVFPVVRAESQIAHPSRRNSPIFRLTITPTPIPPTKPTASRSPRTRTWDSAWEPSILT